MKLSSIERLFRNCDVESDLTSRSVKETFTLNRYLIGVSAAIEKYIGHSLELKSYTEYKDLKYKKNEYFLNVRPISSITELTIDYNHKFDSNNKIVSSDYYRIGSDNNSVILDLGTPSAKMAMKIEYIAGMATTPVTSVFNITSSDTMTVGNWVVGQTSMSYGIIRAYTISSVTIEVINGYFEEGEEIVEYVVTDNDLETMVSNSNSATIVTAASRCLAELYPDIVMACEMQVRYMRKHNNDFENIGTDVNGNTTRRSSNAAYNLEPEVRLMLDKYVREVYFI